MTYLSSGSDVDDIPFDVWVVVLEVDASLDDDLLAGHRAVAHVLKIHLVAVIGPCAELHEALLDVEGEELHVYGAVTLVDGWRLPEYSPVVMHSGFLVQSDDKLAISARTQV